MPIMYEVNQDYFKSIDTEDKAYWLGFIYADGYLNKNGNTFGIELKDTDIEHLIAFGKDIESNRPIKIYNKNSTFGPQVNCRWVCSNKILYNDLIKHGLTATKSYDGKFPIVDDVQYMKDVIRGIFDGDGSIHLKKGSLGYLIAKIAICNTKETLECIEKFSGFEWVWSQRYPDKNVNNYQISTGNQNNIISFLNLIYKDAKIYLNRKYKKYKEYIDSREYANNKGIDRHNYNQIGKNNTSGTKGVSLVSSNKKWHAYITVNKKRINLGYFADIEDAIKARREAEEKYLSDFWTNKGA